MPYGRVPQGHPVNVDYFYHGSPWDREYREKEIAKFKFANLPFERRNPLKGPFLFIRIFAKLQDKAQNFIYSKHKEVEVWL